MKIRTLFLGRGIPLLVGLLIGFLIGGQFEFTFMFSPPSSSSSSPSSSSAKHASDDILVTNLESLQALADETRRRRSEKGRSLDSVLLSNLVDQLCEKVDVVSQLFDQINYTKSGHTANTAKDNNNNNPNNNININNNNSVQKNNPDKDTNNQITKICDCSNNNNTRPTLKVNFNYTKDLPNKKVVILIAASPNNFNRREGIRQTWVNYLKGTPDQDHFVYKFFFGILLDPALKERIEAEQSLFGDIVMLDSFTDTYRNLSYKTIGMMKWAINNYNTTYVLKVDDDTFLRLDRLMPFITTIPTQKHFVGYSHCPYQPYREPSSKWYVTEEEYPSGSVGPVLLAGGAGYLMTKDCAYVVGHRLDDPTYKPLYIEDVNTAMILKEYGVIEVNNALFYAFDECTESTARSQGVMIIFKTWLLIVSKMKKAPFQFTTFSSIHSYQTRDQLFDPSLLCQPFCYYVVRYS